MKDQGRKLPFTPLLNRAGQVRAAGPKTIATARPLLPQSSTELHTSLSPQT